MPPEEHIFPAGGMPPVIDVIGIEGKYDVEDSVKALLQLKALNCESMYHRCDPSSMLKSTCTSLPHSLQPHRYAGSHPLMGHVRLSRSSFQTHRPDCSIRRAHGDRRLQGYEA